MGIRCGNRLQETDRRHVAHRQRVEEIVQIVLVVGPAVVRGADVGGRVWTAVLRVGGGGEILEEGVVWHVILDRTAIRGSGGGLSLAPRTFVAVFFGGIEEAHKGAPGYRLGTPDVA